jgi:hypothetical protein
MTVDASRSVFVMLLVGAMGLHATGKVYANSVDQEGLVVHRARVRVYFVAAEEVAWDYDDDAQRRACSMVRGNFGRLE